LSLPTVTIATMSDDNWIQVIRRQLEGESYFWMAKRELMHAIRPGETQALCGFVPPRGWIERSKFLDELSCQRCRDVLGMGPHGIKPGHPDWSPFMRYN